MLCLGGHLLWGKGWAPVMVQSVVANESEQELEDQLDVELKQSQNQPALESLQSRASPFFKEETEEPTVDTTSTMVLTRRTEFENSLLFAICLLCLLSLSSSV
jgi:hypothetical protein